jgi:predicted Zn-dependent peptidase
VSGGSSQLRAAVVAALFVCAAAGGALAQTPATPAATPAPAPAEPAGPATGVLPSGVTYELRPDPGQPAAAVALWYRAPSTGFDAPAAPGLSRLAAATVAASTPITGTSLGQLVERWGGRLSVAAYPDSVAVTAMVPPDRAAQAVRAMTADYFAPVVTSAGLQLAQRDIGEDAIYRSFGPEAIEDALGTALFANGPLHDGSIATVAGLSAIKLDRVRAFAERAFRPSNAVLVLTGDVDRTALAAAGSRAGAANTDAEPAITQTPRPAAQPVRREGNVAGTGLGWIGPPIAAEADATALDFVADALFAPRTGVVAKALGARKVLVTGKFVTYRNPGIFLVTISGDEAAAARPVVEKALADAAKPMSPAAFEAARAGFVYRLLSEMETPADVADTYGWYTVEGAPAYAPAEGGTRGRYFSLAASLTPAAVAQAVAKYLGPPPAVVTLVKAAPKSRTAT